MISMEIVLKLHNNAVLPVDTLEADRISDPYVVVPTNSVKELLGIQCDKFAMSSEEFEKLDEFNDKYSRGHLTTGGIMIYLIPSNCVELRIISECATSTKLEGSRTCYTYR